MPQSLANFSNHLIILQYGLYELDVSVYMTKKLLEENLGNNYIVVVSNINGYNNEDPGAISYNGKQLAEFTINTIIMLNKRCCNKYCDNKSCDTCNFGMFGKYPPTHCMNNKITSLSFIAYSSGGLIARHCIGCLYLNGIFRSVKPSMYISIGTPHLGINKIENFVPMETICNQTVKSAPLAYIYSNKILERISEIDTIFMKGLALFDKRIVYGILSNNCYISFESVAIYPFIHVYNEEILLEALYVDEKIEKLNISDMSDRIYENLSVLDWKRNCIKKHNYNDTILNDIKKEFKSNKQQYKSKL
jgi:hypothetical protein